MKTKQDKEEKLKKAKEEELKKAQEAQDLLDGKPKKKTLNLKAKAF